MRRLMGFVRLMLQLLRELADESAYARHLARHGASASAHEWRRFSEERMLSRYSSPKCC